MSAREDIYDRMAAHIDRRVNYATHGSQRKTHDDVRFAVAFAIPNMHGVVGDEVYSWRRRAR